MGGWLPHRHPSRVVSLAIVAVATLMPARSGQCGETASLPPSGPEKDTVISLSATYRTSSDYARDYRPLPVLLTGVGPLHTARLPDQPELAEEFAFHTALEDSPYIEIDLGRPSTITGLRVENRRRQLRERARGLTVWLSGDRRSWREVARLDDVRAAWDIHLSTPEPARYVKLGLRRRDYLHLARVEVLGHEVSPGSGPGPRPHEPDGAFIAHSAGDITVLVPRGSVTDADAIHITRASGRDDFSPIDSCFRTLATADITVGKTNVFDQGIVIRAKYDPKDLNPHLAPADQISGWRWDEGPHKWIRMPVEVDEGDRAIITRTLHLCPVKWITEGVSGAVREGGRYLKWAANSYFQMNGTIPHTAYEWTLNRPRMSAAFRVLCDSDALANSPHVGDLAWGNNRVGPPIPVGERPGIPLFVWDLGAALDEAMAYYVTDLGLEPPDTPIVVKIDSWMAKLVPGGGPGCFEPDYDRIHFRSDTKDSWSATNLKFRAAHELFHAFQHKVIGRRWFDHPYAQTGGTYLWWAEACADFVAGRLVTQSKQLVGHGTVYPKLLDFPLNYYGLPPHPDFKELEYDKAWFIDYLVNQKKAPFKEMHLAVANRKDPTIVSTAHTIVDARPSLDPVIDNLGSFLKERTGESLQTIYRDFAGFLLFSKDSVLLTAVPQRDCAEKFDPYPLPAKGGAAAAPIEHTFAVPAYYAIRLWAVKPEPAKSDAGTLTNRTLKVELVRRDPATVADVYVLPLSTEWKDEKDIDRRALKPGGQPAPRLRLEKEGFATRLDVGPEDMIFVVAFNTGIKDPASVVVRISDEGANPQVGGRGSPPTPSPDTSGGAGFHWKSIARKTHKSEEYNLADYSKQSGTATDGSLHSREEWTLGELKGVHSGTMTWSCKTGMEILQPGATLEITASITDETGQGEIAGWISFQRPGTAWNVFDTSFAPIVEVSPGTENMPLTRGQEVPPGNKLGDTLILRARMTAGRSSITYDRVFEWQQVSRGGIARLSTQSQLHR